MNDDARIAKLTKLARRVWPDRETGISTATGAEAVDQRTDDLLVDIGQHPRALDALEAALLVLADEERVPLTERRVLEDRIKAAERDRESILRRYGELHAKLAKIRAWRDSDDGDFAMPQVTQLDAILSDCTLEEYVQKLDKGRP